MECLVGGSRESGFDVWDVNTAANLLSINNNKAAAAQNATAITATSAHGRQQIISADVKKPYLHVSSFTLASHSSNHTSSSSSLPSHLSALALSPSSHFLLAASSSTPTLYLFSLSTSPPTLAASFSSHYRPVTSLAWSADERFVLSGGEDGCVNAHALADVLRDEHADDERQLRHYLPASATLASAAASAPASSKPYVSFSSHSLAVTALSTPALSYQSLLFSASLDHSVHVHSLVSRQTVQRFTLPCALTTVVALQTGSAVLAGGSDGNIYYQPLITSAIKPAASAAAATSAAAASYSTLSGHTGAIAAMAVSNVGSSLLASAAADGSIRLWDLTTLHCVRTLHHSSRPAYTYLAFTHTSPAALPAVDWSGLRGSRARDQQASTLAVTARQREDRRGGGATTDRERSELEAEWRSVRGEGEVSDMRRAVEEERRKREAVEAELEQWKAASRAMYRKVAGRVLEEVKRKENNRLAAEQAPVLGQGREEAESRQDERDDDEVQVVEEVAEEDDERMDDEAADDTGGHVITVE